MDGAQRTPPAASGSLSDRKAQQHSKFFFRPHFWNRLSCSSYIFYFHVSSFGPLRCFFARGPELLFVLQFAKQIKKEGERLFPNAQNKPLVRYQMVSVLALHSRFCLTHRASSLARYSSSATFRTW